MGPPRKIGKIWAIFGFFRPTQKMGREGPKWGGDVFFRHKKILPTFWAERILILRIFVFWIFLGPKILAWAHLGPTWAHPLGPRVGPPTWAPRGPTHLGPSGGPGGPSGRPMQQEGLRTPSLWLHLLQNFGIFWIFPGHGKNGPRWPQKGQDGFFSY